MATRIHRLKHDERTTRRTQAIRLMKRLQSHRQGKLTMTAAQILAAKIVIGKGIPILQKARAQQGEDK